jgi:hypothetical protein
MIIAALETYKPDQSSVKGLLAAIYPARSEIAIDY